MTRSTREPLLVSMHGAMVNNTDQLTRAAKYKRQFRNKREQILALDQHIARLEVNYQKAIKSGDDRKLRVAKDLHARAVAQRLLLWNEVKS